MQPDFQSCVANAVTFNTNNQVGGQAVDQMLASRHLELGLEATGVGFFFPNTPTDGGSATYSWQIINTSDVNGTAGTIVAATTPTWTKAAGPGFTGSGANWPGAFFLPIPLGILTLEYISVNFLTNGAGGPSIAGVSAFVMTQGEFNGWISALAAFTP